MNNVTDGELHLKKSMYEKIINESESIGELIGAIGGIGFNVNNWGSCQYSSALDMFNTLQTLVPVLGREETFKALNITITHDGLNTLKQASDDLLETRKEWFEREIREATSRIPELEKIILGEAPLWRWMKEKADAVKELEYANNEIAKAKLVLNGFVFNNIDEMFELERSEASDLWNAGPTIANLIFKNLNVTAERYDGFGPPMNVEVQSDNYSVGACCWLLWTDAKEYIKGKSDDIFGNFDT